MQGAKILENLKVFGGFESVSKPWGMKGIPEDFMYGEL
jgi:hypothetical protein